MRIPSLRQRRAVVLGAGGTFGKAVVERLCADGYQVGALDSDQDRLAELEAGGQAVWSLKLGEDDDSDSGSVVEHCRDRWGEVDAFAAVDLSLDHASIEEMRAADWRRSVRINLIRPAMIASGLLPLLRPAGGAMVLLGSIDGLFANPTQPAYSASRGGIIPLCHVLAHAGAPDVRVNVVAVGGVLPRDLPASTTRVERLSSATPLARLGQPSELSGVISFLLSEEASYVNGTVVTVDGGRTALTPGTFTSFSGVAVDSLPAPPQQT